MKPLRISFNALPFEVRRRFIVSTDLFARQAAGLQSGAIPLLAKRSYQNSASPSITRLLAAMHNGIFAGFVLVFALMSFSVHWFNSPTGPDRYTWDLHPACWPIDLLCVLGVLWPLTLLLRFVLYEIHVPFEPGHYLFPLYYINAAADELIVYPITMIKALRIDSSPYDVNYQNSASRRTIDITFADEERVSFYDVSDTNLAALHRILTAIQAGTVTAEELASLDVLRPAAPKTDPVAATSDTPSAEQSAAAAPAFGQETPATGPRVTTRLRWADTPTWRFALLVFAAGLFVYENHTARADWALFERIKNDYDLASLFTYVEKDGRLKADALRIILSKLKEAHRANIYIRELEQLKGNPVVSAQAEVQALLDGGLALLAQQQAEKQQEVDENIAKLRAVPRDAQVLAFLEKIAAELRNPSTTQLPLYLTFDDSLERKLDTADAALAEYPVVPLKAAFKPPNDVWLKAKLLTALENSFKRLFPQLGHTVLASGRSAYYGWQPSTMRVRYALQPTGEVIRHPGDGRCLLRMMLNVVIHLQWAQNGDELVLSMASLPPVLQGRALVQKPAANPADFNAAQEFEAQVVLLFDQAAEQLKEFLVEGKGAVQVHIRLNPELESALETGPLPIARIQRHSCGLKKPSGHVTLQ